MTPSSSAADDLALAVRAAHHLADLTAQMYIDALWRAKNDPDETRWMLNRLAAELRSARTVLAATQDTDWWESASVDAIAHACQLARTWGRAHPDIAGWERQLLATIEGRTRAAPLSA
ncbi:hypothetical protein [Rathayibacter tanaceti]|uniref:Uncharacterized protein n=2 Tax=Rathayibacter tanaceti TaxID=1671680 RepID=A0A162GQF9_9MICO|nr:hypothetical protein [Rathayibacter tanaceti]KZX21168.1 hypothetical protein ACH61_01715 [Rathayibacter tanaceti]QHC54249.1 hypothetical protein GSU10_00310 [Rathayibacter tanaceti]TCO37926.1 hypothetical protein EV639_103113 [Rathayibacter tanaceti]